MLNRIVRLSIRKDAVDDFLRAYRESAPRVRSFPGCHDLALWSDPNHDGVYATFSVWTDEAALERYRESDEFKSIWSRLKPFFAAPARAESFLPLNAEGSGVPST